MSCSILPSLKHFLTFTARHCKWDDWVEGECSAACGVGTRNNTRTKSVVEANGGTCSGQPTETVECKIKDCPSMQFILLRILLTHILFIS